MFLVLIMYFTSYVGLNQFIISIEREEKLTSSYKTDVHSYFLIYTDHFGRCSKRSIKNVFFIHNFCDVHFE